MTVQSVFSSLRVVHSAPGSLDARDAGALLLEARKVNKEGTTGTCCWSREGTGGTEGLRVIFSANLDAFNDDAKANIRGWLGMQGPVAGGTSVSTPTAIEDNHPVGGASKILLKKTAHKHTFNCPWFPHTLRANSIGANLYSDPRGVGHSTTEKYDKAFGKNSTAIERATSSGHKEAWAGHCDMAARISCLLQKPTKPVTRNGVTFEPNQIMGLLVMISNDLAGEEPFIGNRFDTRTGSDRNEPYPHVFIPKLIELTKNGESVILDVTPTDEVWNYPYDQFEVEEFNDPVDGLGRMRPMSSGNVVKYQSHCYKGTGYTGQPGEVNEIRNYRSWIEYGPDGEALRSGWYPVSPDGKHNPDFMWQAKARGDLRNKANWPTACSYNSGINPQDVFDIYMESIA